jgi:16S rRNA processing protein RimM
MSGHVVVGRLRKPHGLKGDCNLFPLTDDPAQIFAPGREIWVIDLAGKVRAHFLSVPPEALGPLTEDEVYLHELDGFAVRLPDETPLGLVSAVYELPAGLMIQVQGPKREFLLPYKKEFVQQVDRAGRRLVVTPPEGLLE